MSKRYEYARVSSKGQEKDGNDLEDKESEPDNKKAHVCIEKAIV